MTTTIEYADAGTVDAVTDVDAVFVMTKWDEFQNRALHQGKRVFAGRGILDLSQVEELAGYEGLGW